MSHLLGIQETNSQGVYRTHTHVISSIYLGFEPGLLRFNKPWGFLNTKVMGHLEPVNPEAYDRLHEQPNYPEVLRMLTNGHGE